MSSRHRSRSPLSRDRDRTRHSGSPVRPRDRDSEYANYEHVAKRLDENAGDKRSKDKKKRKDKSRDASDDEDEELKELPNDAQPISESDYFLKSAEFREWLKEEKDRYFDELSGEKARSYFRKFVKAWNRGKLPNSYYAGIDPASQRAASGTAYRWSFAGSRSRAEEQALEAARRAVSAATRGEDENSSSLLPMPGPSMSFSSSTKTGRIQGPAMPPPSELTLIREAASSARAASSMLERKRARAEERDRVEDMVGPKEAGREGQLEKKRVKREEGRARQAERDDAFGEVDEGTLMGGGDSFKARIAQRDAARRRFEEKRMSAREEKIGTVRERQDAIREKDKATMDMFKQMAKERFG